MRMFWYGSPGVWGWAFGLGSILFWVLVVAAIVALVGLSLRGGRRPGQPYRGEAGGQGPYGQPGPPPVQASPEQILAERFARGEINEEEFHRRMAVLRDESQPPGPPTAPTWRDLAARPGITSPARLSGFGPGKSNRRLKGTRERSFNPAGRQPVISPFPGLPGTAVMRKMAAIAINL